MCRGRSVEGAGNTGRTNVVYRVVGRHALGNRKNIKRWILIKERAAEAGKVSGIEPSLEEAKTGVLEACLEHTLEDKFLVDVCELIYLEEFKMK
jgi:energy-converting hydrogenase A subunit M